MHKLMHSFTVLNWSHWTEIITISMIFGLIIIKNSSRNANSITGSLLILISMLASSLYYISILIIIDPENSLTLALSSDILSVPVDHVATTVRKMIFGEPFSPTYNSFQMNLDVGLLKLHFVALQIIVAQFALFLIVYFTGRSWVPLVFAILLYYYSIYPNLDTIINCFLIMDTPIWLNDGSVNMDILSKHQFNIKNSKYNVCRFYSKEEMIQLIEHYVNLCLKGILESYKDSKIPPGFQQYICNIIMFHIKENLHKKLKGKIELNTLTGFIAFAFEVTKIFLPKHKIAIVIRAYLKKPGFWQ